MRKVYWPEMKEEKPEAKIESSLSHYGKHYFLNTELELKSRRGLKFLERRDRWNDGIMVNLYKATIRAYEQICEEYDVSHEALLD